MANTSTTNHKDAGSTRAKAREFPRQFSMNDLNHENNSDAERYSVAKRKGFIRRVLAKHPILDDDQERSMIERYLKCGDRDGLNEELVLDNISLLNPFFDKYDSAYFGNTDDMIGVGVKALEDAAKAFDPKRRVRFSTYAWRWINGAFGRNIPYKREKPTSSIDYDPRKGKSPSTYDDAVLRDDDDEVDSTQIADPSASKTISDRDYRSIVERVLGMAQMQGKMNQMLWMFYIDGYSLKEIANKMNIPREQTVGAYISTARSRIRKMLGKCGIHSKSELLSKLDRLNI